MIPNPVFLETFKAFKANPVPMPFGELYGALEAKAVDGQENPFSVILSNKFFEVQKYVSATNHVYCGQHRAGQQEVLGQAVPGRAEDACARPPTRRAATKPGRAARRRQGAVGELKAKGMQFNEVAAAEQARMRQVAKPVTEKFSAGYDAANVKLFNAELERVQKIN